MGKSDLLRFIITAFPGLYKLLLILSIDLLFSDKEMASFVNDSFIIMIISLFTNINWQTFVLTDMLKLPESRRIPFFERLFWTSFPTIILGLSAVYLLSFFGVVVSPTEASFFLLAWSFHQLWRNFFIAEKSYLTLFWADILFSLLSAIGLFFSFVFNINLLTTLGIASLATPFIFQISGVRQPRFNFSISTKLNTSIYIQSFEYSLINLSTGGIQLFFAPLSYQILDDSTTSLIGTITNISAVVILLPRALTFKYTPVLVEHFRHNLYKITDVFLRFKQTINWFVFLTITIGICFTVFYRMAFESETKFFVIIVVLIFSNHLISQLSLPASNLLVIIKQSRVLLKVNITSLFLYIIIFLISWYWYDGITVLLISISAQIILNLYRAFQLNNTCIKLIGKIQNRS